MHARARRVLFLLASGDADRTIEPLRLVYLLQPTVEFRVATPLHADQIAMAVARQRFDVIVAHHAAIADEHHPSKREARAQIRDHILHRRRIDAVARPYVMRDRPARHHHHADHHLHVLRLAVATVAVFGEVLRSRSLEVGTCDVVQHQVRLQAEQVAQTMVERDLDLGLRLDEHVQRAIPRAELTMMHLHASLLLPVRHEASPLPIAHEVGLQPTRQAVLAGRPNQAVGQQDERALGKTRPFLGARQKRVEGGPKPELIEERPHSEHRPPSRGINDLDGIRIFSDRRRRAEQHALQVGEQSGEDVLASEIGDDALLDLAVVPIGLDDAHVLVDGAARGRNFDGADEHGVSIITRSQIHKINL